MKMNKLTTWILLALLAGIGVGYLCHELAPDAAAAKEIAGYFSILTDIFLRMIKMIIAPLVFATLVAGLAGMGDSKTVGRIGAKALGWFVGASFCSLLLGLLWVGQTHSLDLPGDKKGEISKSLGRLIEDEIADAAIRRQFGVEEGEWSRHGR